MNEPIKRINPRRPFHVTTNGLKRIVLGEIGVASGSVPIGGHGDAPKPLRLNGETDSHILAIVHSDRGLLDAEAQQAIAAAALLADQSTAVAVLVLGDLTEGLASLGADKVFTVPACDKDIFDPERDLSIVKGMVEKLDPHHIILPDSAILEGDLGRRLAARTERDIATHVVELGPEGVAAYWQGGAAMARRDLSSIILLDPETTDIALPFRGKGEIVDHAIPASEASDAYEDRGMPPVDFTALELEEADFIISAGNGVADVATLEALARVFNAAVGASRVAVDDGKFSRDKQIGATGKTVNANVYLAIGISGAVQHLQGIRSCRHVISINTDASAPMAGRADLTIVEDAQQVMEHLLDATRGRNWSGDEASQ